MHFAEAEVNIVAYILDREMKKKSLTHKSLMTGVLKVSGSVDTLKLF